MRAKNSPPTHRKTCKLSYNITSIKDSGFVVHITPVVIHPIVKPLNRVIKSPNHSYEFFLTKNKPPHMSPKPAPNSPYATNHQTKNGKS